MTMTTAKIVFSWAAIINFGVCAVLGAYIHTGPVAFAFFILGITGTIAFAKLSQRYRRVSKNRADGQNPQ